MARHVSVSMVGPRLRERREAYIATFMTGSSLQKSWLEAWMVMKRWKGMRREERRRWNFRHRALAHLIHSTLVNLNVFVGSGKGKYKFKFQTGVPAIPIPYHLWEAELGGRGTWAWMLDQGLLDNVSEPDHRRGLCREFRLSRWVIETFVRAGLEDTDPRVFNLFTGKEVARMRRSPATDPQRHPWFRRGSVGSAAYVALSESRCYVNLQGMKAAVAKLRREADLSHSERARRRALCAEAALLSIKLEGGLQRERSIGPDIWSYQPAYCPSTTGRIHEIGLGVQGCPREIKAAAFDFPGVINYDLTASLATSLLVAVDQYNAAIAEARRGGRFNEEDVPALIDDWWLRDYISNPKRGSAWLAVRIGVSKEVAKEIFYAIMFGARVHGAVRDVLVEHFEGDDAKVNEALRRVRRILCHRQRDGKASLVRMLDQVDDLVFSHINREGIFRSPKIAAMITSMKINRTRHGTSIVNAVGRSMMVLDVHGDRIIRDDDVRVAERHVRCHLTQGIEQEFIAKVVVELLKEPEVVQKRIRTMSQQHDGIVIWTSLSIEEADRVVQLCVERARASCALGQFARLEIKPIG